MLLLKSALIDPHNHSIHQSALRTAADTGRPNMWHGQRHPWRSYNDFTFARDVRCSGEAGQHWVSSGIPPAKLLLELPGFVDEVEIGVAPVVLIFRPSIPPGPQPHRHGSRRCISMN